MSTKRDQYYENIWNQVIQYLRDESSISSEVLSSFFSQSYIYDISETTSQCKVIIVVDGIISKQIIVKSEDSLSAAFTSILSLETPVILDICLESELEQKKPTLSEQLESYIPFDDDFASMPIQPDRTFDNFVVGDCNKESQAAALACALNPGRYFNPLFIYGNSGLGKTHLLMAIGNYVKKNYPDRNVYYVESLKFVDKVVKAIQNNKINEFKKFMSNMDVLLVDDIQFLAGKEKSHEVFFSIYNELVNNRKQICLASDRQPREIKGLEDRLISRFNQGLSVGIDSPEFETSLAILRMKIKNSGNDIEEVDERGLSYIASNFSGNVRDLEGAWNRVLFYAIMFQKDKSCITFETVVNALKNQAVVSEKDGLSPNKIIKTVADYYGLTKQQITSKTRTKNIANARHISIYLCRNLLNLSYIKIGDEFGGRDHSTIISACTKVEKQIKKEPAFANAINDIKNLLQS